MLRIQLILADSFESGKNYNCFASKFINFDDNNPIQKYQFVGKLDHLAVVIPEIEY